MLSIKKILLPTDFSAQAGTAYQFACALARDYGAKLLLVHVKQPPILVVGEFGASVPEPPPTDDALRQQLLLLQPAGLPWEHFLAEGDPATEIVRIAKDQHADLIVMGTHGRKGIGRLIMGSVAEQVMRRASCPVLSVKLPAA